MIINAVIVMLALQMTFVFYAFASKKNVVNEITYSLIMVVSMTTLLFTSKLSKSIEIATILVLIWGIKAMILESVIFISNRKNLSTDNNYTNPIVKAILQCISIFVLIFPALASLSSRVEDYNTILIFIGLIIWFVGFVSEIISDYKKISFRDRLLSKSESESVILTFGHPRYLGEIFIWWGIYLVTFPFLGNIRLVSLIMPIYATSFTVFSTILPEIKRRKEAPKEKLPIPKRLVTRESTSS